MNSTTIHILNRLEETSWFSRVGAKDNSGAAVVGSWPEAMEYCTSPDWDDLQEEALNQFRECIAQRSMARLRLWNETVDEIKKITKPLVDRKIAAVVRENNLPIRFSAQVNYDVSGLCLEAECSDICRPGLFTRMAYWYLDGHFPCGWWGPFPDGKLIIY